MFLTNDEFYKLLTDVRAGIYTPLEKDRRLNVSQYEILKSCLHASPQCEWYDKSLRDNLQDMSEYDVKTYEKVIDLRLKSLQLAKEFGGDPENWDDFKDRAKRIMRFAASPVTSFYELRELKKD